MPPRLPLSSIPRVTPSLTSSSARRLLPTTSSSLSSASSTAQLSTTATAGSTPDGSGHAAAADHHHDDHGHGEWFESDSSQQWFMGVPPGEKYKKEGWENVTYWGFGGGILAAMVAYAYKPDSSIQTWALEEARRRLEKEGILPDPDDLPKKA